MTKIFTPSQLGNAVRGARTTAGLSQNELATQVGVNRKTLANIEAGNGNPTLHLLLRLSSVLQEDIVLSAGKTSTKMSRLRRRGATVITKEKTGGTKSVVKASARRRTSARVIVTRVDLDALSAARRTQP